MKSKLIRPYISLKSYITKRRFAKYNKTCYFAKNVQIIGTKKINLGRNVTICRDTWININNRESPTVYMAIGDNSFIGRNNFFTVGKKIVIGKYFFSSKDCKFIGAGHEMNPFQPYILGNVGMKNEIIIGDNVFIGAGVTICGNVTIGDGVVIGANSLVTSDIPPLSLAVGTPAKVIKKFDMNDKEWKKIELFDKNNFDTEKYDFGCSIDLGINYFAAENYWI